MRFGMKVLMCSLILMLCLFGVSGYMMISHNYRQALENEAARGMEENQLLRTAFYSSLLRHMADGEITLDRTMMAAVGGELSAGINDSLSFVCLADSGKQSLFSGNEGAQRLGWEPLLDGLENGEKSWRICHIDGKYELQTAGLLGVSEQTFYLINVRNITSVYDNVREQLGFYRRMLVGLTLLCAVLMLAMFKVLMKPIKRLDEYTSKMADGDYSVRVRKCGGDEIGQLGKKFNLMAGAIERHVKTIEDENQRKEAFVANFTHELKTPLTTMIGYADMLRSKNVSEEIRFEAADYIVTEGIRLENMSGKLFELFLSKNREVEKSPVLVEQLMAQVAASVKPKLLEKKQNLVMESQGGTIFGDQELLASAFINFIDNGMKASCEGADIIFRSFREEKHHIYIEVSDPGCGIPKEDIDKVKDAFYMVDKSRARQAGGAGLGLTLAAQILKLHGARWDILSEVDVGTTIVVEFCTDGPGGLKK